MIYSFPWITIHQATSVDAQLINGVYYELIPTTLNDLHLCEKYNHTLSETEPDRDDDLYYHWEILILHAV